MPTLTQLCKKKRIKRKRYIMCKALALVKAPQLRGVCYKVTTMTPKKPNSAIRKIAKVRLSNGKKILAYIMGQGHNLQEHSVVMVRGGKTKDLPGLHYKLIRGKYDFSAVEKFKRSNGKSKYGISKDI